MGGGRGVCDGWWRRNARSGRTECGGTAVGGAVARVRRRRNLRAAGQRKSERRVGGDWAGAGEQERRQALAPDAPLAGDQGWGQLRRHPDGARNRRRARGPAIKFERSSGCVRATGPCAAGGLPLPVRRLWQSRVGRQESTVGSPLLRPRPLEALPAGRRAGGEIVRSCGAKPFGDCGRERPSAPGKGRPSGRYLTGPATAARV